VTGSLEAKVAMLEAELRELTRARDELLSVLGHELRNPLAPIVAALEVAKLRGHVTERELAVIDRHVTQLRHLVDDLLDLSLLVRGKVSFALAAVPLDRALADALEATAHLRDAPLTVDAAHGMRLAAERARLVQALAHALAASAQPRAVLVGVAGDLAVIRIESAGPSLSSGHGLALVLVEKLVTLHGGTVSATADALTLSWPLATADLPATAPASFAVRPRKVLVVDDNIDAAETLADMLRLLGHEVAVAHDGAAALEAATVSPPQLALLDLGMPVMDGYELARRLRALPQLGGVSLVALTGYGTERERERALQSGFDDHVVKPLDPALLARLLDET
jgi:CheY-like chemotaxis protein